MCLTVVDQLSGSTGEGDFQGIHGAHGHAHAAASAGFGIDLRAALVDCGDGLVVAALAAGHADHVIPCDAGVTVQAGFTDAGCGRIDDLELHWAGLDTGLAEGAAGRTEIEIRHTGQFMVGWMPLDDARITGCGAGMRTPGTVCFQGLAAVPGRDRPQWLPPLYLPHAAIAA